MNVMATPQSAWRRTARALLLDTLTVALVP
jgi:hypothetical protein